ncbi:ComEA family DNA-binding protein [Blastococcus haudaquaticus]|uniref:Competence protein ComEA n=1 Tax=Blastococcus haudaquaticus TaxID=1938745 RepID=A0A286H339_9ACTN|nr:ComEA family DNA-binding protein [Blastococcus haudaquaticus]SOE02205.1 competence protein ComEA [Blastococcus haudaquaticus]
MRFPSRRIDDDADVIRARLRRLLDERAGSGGWVPDEIDDEDPAGRHDVGADRDWAGEDSATGPIPAVDARAELPGGVGRHRAPGSEQRWDPGRPGARSLWIAGVLAALLLVGWTWLQRPQVERVDGAPAASSAPSTPPVGTVAEASATVVVSVVGQVAAPGLVSLPPGSRVADAIAAAGGLLPGADPASVNLAAPVTDGEQLTVGLPAAAAEADPAGAGGAPEPSGRVDLNRAGVTELDALPGIGPVLAQRIVEHRDRQGPFRSVEELDDVPGIGPAIAAELADLVTV